MHFDLSNEFEIPPVDFRSDDGSKEFPNHWHFKATNEEKSEKMRFFAIIQVNPNDQVPLEINQTEEGQYEIGEWQINVTLNIDKPARINVWKKDNSVAFSSMGSVQLNDKEYAKETSTKATLVEVIDGKERIQSVSDTYPDGFIEASYYAIK